MEYLEREVPVAKKRVGVCEWRVISMGTKVGGCSRGKIGSNSASVSSWGWWEGRLELSTAPAKGAENLRTKVPGRWDVSTVFGVRKGWGAGMTGCGGATAPRKAVWGGWRVGQIHESGLCLHASERSSRQKHFRGGTSFKKMGRFGDLKRISKWGKNDEKCRSYAKKFGRTGSIKGSHRLLKRRKEICPRDAGEGG